MIRRLRDYIFSIAFVGILGFFLVNYIIMPVYVNWRDEVRVPSLTHTTLSEASRLLKARNLQWTVKDTIFRVDIEPEFVMDQHPEAGQMVKEKRRVQLTISIPPPKQQMPNLIARTERQARIAIEKLGAILRTVNEDSSDYFERTVVIEQSIPTGVPVAVGDSIDITVSLGKRNFKKLMPDLLNKSLSEAMRSIREEGFELGEITYISNADLLPNTVVSQSITAGKVFPRERDIKVDILVTTE